MLKPRRQRTFGMRILLFSLSMDCHSHSIYSLRFHIHIHIKVNLPGASAFVPQDDRLHGFYTCKKYMQHYARLAGLTSGQETNNRIDTLLQDLGLSEQWDTIVGDIFLKGLSGGQRRRLSVALEALTYPNNFFLDEPTSGLDAESAFQVMDFLRKYSRAAQGRRGGRNRRQRRR